MTRSTASWMFTLRRVGSSRIQPSPSPGCPPSGRAAGARCGLCWLCCGSGSGCVRCVWCLCGVCRGPWCRFSLLPLVLPSPVLRCSVVLAVCLLCPLPCGSPLLGCWLPPVSFMASLPATVVRGVWCQALSLPRPSVLWSGQPGFRDPCVLGAVGAGVGTQHRSHSVRPCGPALLPVGVAEGRPRGGCLPPL